MNSNRLPAEHFARSNQDNALIWLETQPSFTLIQAYPEGRLFLWTPWSHQGGFYWETVQGKRERKGGWSFSRWGMDYPESLTICRFNFANSIEYPCSMSSSLVLFCSFYFKVLKTCLYLIINILHSAMVIFSKTMI